MLLGIWKFSFAPIEAKIQLFKSYCLWMCSLASFIPELYQETYCQFQRQFKRLINVPRYTSSSLAFATNSTDHINVVFRKFAYSLMSRATASPNSIVSAIVNSDDRTVQNFKIQDDLSINVLQLLHSSVDELTKGIIITLHCVCL